MITGFGLVATDTFNGGKGNDILRGEQGDDVLLARMATTHGSTAATATTRSPGRGNDTIEAAQAATRLPAGPETTPMSWRTSGHHRREPQRGLDTGRRLPPISISPRTSKTSSCSGPTTSTAPATSLPT